MTPEKYTEFCKTTAIYPGAGTGSVDELMYLALGLGECGEVQGKVKKLYRDGRIDYEAVALELGDIMWYVALLADAAGYGLEDIMELNMHKLTKRKEAGTIGGSGDYR